MSQYAPLILTALLFALAFLVAVSRHQARTRRSHELSRSNARVVREVKRMAVYEPTKIIETQDK